MESTITRKIMWTATVLLAATVAACGGSTQETTGTVPSLVSPIAASSDSGGSLGLLKEGKGKGHSPVPEIGTTPDPDDPETGEDAGEPGHGHGHGKAVIQYEGFTKSIAGTCPELTIVFDDKDATTVKTEDLTTEFQRATCDVLAAAGETPVHLHVAAKIEDEALVAIYVRMQGPKDHDGDDEEVTTLTTTTN